MCLREKEADAETQVDEGEEADVDEADNILQRPVINKQSVRMCIAASTTRIEFMTKNSVEDVVFKYPYLKEADLVSKDTNVGGCANTPSLKYFRSYLKQ